MIYSAIDFDKFRQSSQPLEVRNKSRGNVRKYTEETEGNT